MSNNGSFAKTKETLKQMIRKALTFITNLQGTILPMQLICSGKTVPSLTKFHFPAGFPAESIKIIKELIVP